MNKIKKSLSILLTFVLLLALALWLMYRPLPAHDHAPSYRLPVQTDSLLAQQLLPLAAQHPDKTGIYPLNNSRDAFLARLSLAETAKHSLDIQYYIWHDDISGHLLLQSLYKAAQRGVRVRLLLDDNNSKGMDTLLATLNAHANIDIRLFNPFMQRDHRYLGYATDFFRLNRRMHNKSFTADGLVSIVGGRNIGDEYFGAGSGVLFADLDVAAVGKVVSDIENDFDRYWNSPSAFPAEHIINANPESAFDTAPANHPETQNYLHALAQSAFAQQLRAGSLNLLWTEATLVSDDPAKALGQTELDNSVIAHITPLFAAAQTDITIVSPYFVPTKRGAQLLSDTAQRGVKLTILTNSLAATDVAAVHAGYAKYRKKLLEAGIALLELKPDATVKEHNHHLFTGSSGASLHAKTFAIDGQQLFIGSFNMDPRSADLNTEMGLILKSPELATKMQESLAQYEAEHAYRVQLQDGELQWHTQEGQSALSFDQEPNSSLPKRLAVWICAHLPIEWLL